MLFSLRATAFLLLPTTVLASTWEGAPTQAPATRQPASLPIYNGGEIEITQGDVFQQCNFDGFVGACINDTARFEAAMLDPFIIDVPLCNGFVYRPTFSTVLTGFNKSVRCQGQCIIDGQNFQGGPSAFVSTRDSILEFCGLTFQNFLQPVGGRRGARVFELEGISVRAKFRFTTFINNGFNSGGLAPEDSDGGAMTIRDSARVEIGICVFLDNQSVRNGGAIAVVGPSLVNITESRFARNRATQAGAALSLLADTDASITQSILTDNVAGRAGGVVSAASGAAIVISRSTVANNNGGLIGGVLSIGTNSYAAFFDTVFDSNIANFGGVIHAGSSLVLLQEVIMIANNATTSGGAMFTYENGISEIIDSQFELNAAGEYGGAIFMSDTSNVDLETTNFDSNVVLRGIRRGDHILVGKGADLDGCTFEVNQFSNPVRTVGVVDENGKDACNE